MNSTNTVVANAMAARNAAPKGLKPTTKLRLKEDFSDEYGSYRKGDVFPMYAMGGINPRFGTMTVPGRGVTLQIPWEKLEVVNAVARNSVEVEVSLMYAGRVQHAMRDAARSVSGVRVTGTNTLSCPDEDAADEVVDILEQAGVPKREISLNSKRVARNANDWIDDPKKKKAMDEIDKKADALYRQLKDIARKFDALKNEQAKVGFYFADYSDAARQIREIHGME